RSQLAAAFGGLVYGFSPYMFAQVVPHVQMAAAAVSIPLMLLLVDEALVRQRMRPWKLGILIAAVSVAQFFVLEEYLVTEVIAILLLALVLAVSKPRLVRSHFRYAMSAAVVAGAATILVLAYPVVHVQL